MNNTLSLYNNIFLIPEIKSITNFIKSKTFYLFISYTLYKDLNSIYS